MVGRTSQLDGLRSALAAAADGVPATVVLGGEAGVGKTRLVTEFAAEAERDGALVVVGQCVSLGGEGLAYAPVAGALRELAAQLGVPGLLAAAGPGRAALRTLLPDLPGADGDDDPGGTSQGRVFEAVTGLLEHVAADRPLVLVLEDLHWADRSTRQLLGFAVRALGTARVLIVGTYRSDEVSRDHPLRILLAELERVRTVHRIDVPRLTEDEVALQLAGLAGTAPATDAVRRIHARSEGVPFFVEQLADLDDGTTLPESLRDLLLIRVEQLSDESQRLVRLLAVGRDSVGHDLLAAVAAVDPDALDRTLREAVSANVLRVDGDGYAFRHALVHEAVHLDLLPGEHARLHALYAGTLERQLRAGAAGRSLTAEAAHHWFCAHEHAKSFTASLGAAAEARSLSAYDEAQHNYERALELWDQVPDAEATAGFDHTELLGRTAAAASNAGEVDRALALVEAALTEARAEASTVEPARVARLLGFRGTLLSELGLAGATDEVRRALELIPADPPSPRRARLLQKYVSRLMMDGSHAEAIALSAEAAELAHRTGEAESEYRAYVVLGPCLLHSGRVDEGLEALETAHRLAGDRPEWLVGYHINMSDSLHLLGRYAEAAEVARAGIDRARAVGLARTLGTMMAGNAAEPLLALGHWDKAERMITRALELDPPGRHVWQLVGLQSWLELWRGDVGAASQSAAEIRERLAGREPGPQYVLPVTRAGAEAALGRGEPGVAWDLVRATMDGLPGRHPGYELPLLAAAAWALEARSRDGARAGTDADWLRGRLEPIAGWGPGPVWAPVIEAHLAGLDGPAPDAWRRALDAVERAEGPAHLRPFAGHRLGEAYVLLGDRAAAEEPLRRAADEADRLGAGLVRRWIDDLVRRARLGLPPSPSGPNGDTGTFPALTDREREVLLLVAAGRSNRQIGEELYISAKTASVHVSNILAKLGVSGRGEAAALAHRNHLLDEPERRPTA
ncbi:helix-turn-helix transcriptional regulator [Jiangella mangrovi]|uniref:DNA-binding CsgD family transcriptional regulator/tetratricopeptide (TPR) repeat protein n=1 Tax=Jiangella mangrovi TaxID=1524084 RepID=A0A7W9GLD7_9ACTN|nr:helix-turn-helix transcriptional regulator [Jiangella mangrovi]MBB5785910.1 DNA-binding CsgD family transcriptional regulator/tetratricopeptide (TPR) repeat protein [Jiangella mangrovi]